MGLRLPRITRPIFSIGSIALKAIDCIERRALVWG
jgi:hypothetical protein